MRDIRACPTCRRSVRTDWPACPSCGGLLEIRIGFTVFGEPQEDIRLEVPDGPDPDVPPGKPRAS